jgi:hypothetical protein
MNSSLFILNRRRNFFGVFDASSVGVQQHGTRMMRPYVDSCSPPCQASSRPSGNDIVELLLDLQEKGKPKYSNAIYGRRLPLHPLAHPIIISSSLSIAAGQTNGRTPLADCGGDAPVACTSTFFWADGAGGELGRGASSVAIEGGRRAKVGFGDDFF